VLTEFGVWRGGGANLCWKYSFHLRGALQHCLLPADSSHQRIGWFYLIPGTQDALRIPLGGAQSIELDATAQHLLNERALPAPAWSWDRRRTQNSVR